MVNRPTRRRAADRLTTPDGHQTRGLIACDMIVAQFDRAVRAMDARWGIDALPGILPPEPPASVPAEQHAAYRTIPERYGQVIEDMRRALEANDVEACRAAVDRACKALALMDSLATAAGLQALDALAWEVELPDGRRAVIVRDVEAWKVADARFPGATIVTAQEAAHDALGARSGARMLDAAMKAFPGADFQYRQPPGVPVPTADDLDDVIPF